MKGNSEQTNLRFDETSQLEDNFYSKKKFQKVTKTLI